MVRRRVHDLSLLLETAIISNPFGGSIVQASDTFGHKLKKFFRNLFALIVGNMFAKLLL